MRISDWSSDVCSSDLAITGENALAYLRATEGKLKKVGDLVRGGADEIYAKVEQLLERGKQLDREIAALKGKLASSAGSDLASQAQDIKGVKLLAEIGRAHV